MLLPFLPLPHILPAVGPTKSPKPMLFVILIFTLIDLPIRPLNLTLSMHLVVFPLTDVFAVLEPVVGAYSLDKNKEVP